MAGRHPLPRVHMVINIVKTPAGSILTGVLMV
jgi:hypothetical protein